MFPSIDMFDFIDSEMAANSDIGVQSAGHARATSSSRRSAPPIPEPDPEPITEFSDDDKENQDPQLMAR